MTDTDNLDAALRSMLSERAQDIRSVPADLLHLDRLDRLDESRGAGHRDRKSVV